MRRRWTGSVEDRVLVTVLVFLFLVSLAVPIYERVADVVAPASWDVPVLLAALYAIVRLVGPVPQIRTDVKYLRDIADIGVQRMPNVKDFYDSLSRAVDHASVTLDLTHIRSTPPADFGEDAGAFFAKLIAWSSVEGRSIRRIISVQSPAMYEWAKQLARETEHISRFEIKVIDWRLKAPALNMAIVDSKATYLAITGRGPLQRTKGLGVEDTITSQYFTDYYEHLWDNSVYLREWLEGTSWEGS